MFLTKYAKPVQLLGVDDRIKQMLGREPCDASNIQLETSHGLLSQHSVIDSGPAYSVRNITTKYAKPVQLLGVDDRIKQMLGREPCDASNCVVSSTHFLGLKFRTRTQSTI
jgi:hypothetical protein